MWSYVQRRLVTLIPVLIGVTLAVFSMLHLLPGDPAMMMLTEHRAGAAPTVVGNITPEMIEGLRRELGLDRPLPEQYVRFVVNAAQGDLGTSFRTGQPAMSTVARNFVYTLHLAIASLFFSLVFGLFFGILAAVYRDKLPDSIAMTLAMVGVSMPNFWLGILLLLLFSLHLGWIPALAPVGDWRSLVLPAITLGFSASAIVARLVRSSLIEALHQDYVRTARAKGVERFWVVVRHALRNSLIPVATIAGLQFGNLLSGSVVVEVVFGRPGIGQLAVDAILEKDFPVVQAVVLIAALSYVLMNFLVDILYAWLDPRINYRGAS